MFDWNKAKKWGLLRENENIVHCGPIWVRNGPKIQEESFSSLDRIDGKLRWKISKGWIEDMARMSSGNKSKAKIFTHTSYSRQNHCPFWVYSSVRNLFFSIVWNCCHLLIFTVILLIHVTYDELVMPRANISYDICSWWCVMSSTSSRRGLLFRYVLIVSLRVFVCVCTCVWMYMGVCIYMFECMYVFILYSDVKD